MLDQPKDFFAFARCMLLKDRAALEDAVEHAARIGPSAAVRPGADPGHCLYWSRSGGPSGDYAREFDAYVTETGARVRGGAALAVHMLIGISPEWVMEMGGLHDQRNPRVQKLFFEAKNFAERHIGGVLAIRMDLDERGGGIVDVIAAPIHERKSRLRKDGTRGDPILEVSVRTALESLPKKQAEGKSYIALQTMWSKHARDNLDSRIIRGVPYSITARRHQSPRDRRVFEQQNVIDRETREGQLKTVLGSLARNAQMLDRLDARDKELDSRSVQLLDGLKAREKELDTRSAQMLDELKIREKELESRNVQMLDALKVREQKLDSRNKTLNTRDRRSERRAREALELLHARERQRGELYTIADVMVKASFGILEKTRKEEQLYREKNTQRAFEHTAALDELDKERREVVSLRDAYAERLRSLDARERAAQEREQALVKAAALIRLQEGSLTTKLNEATKVAQRAETATRTAQEREAVADAARIKFEEEARLARSAAAANREASGRALEAEQHHLLAQGDALQKEKEARRERDVAEANRKKTASELAYAQSLQTSLAEKQLYLQRLEGEAADEVERARRFEAALTHGMTKIEQGELAPSQISTDPILRPAENLLQRIFLHIGNTLQKRSVDIENTKRGLAVREAELRSKEKTDLASRALRAREVEESGFWQAIQPSILALASQCRSPEFASLATTVQKSMTDVVDVYRRLKYGPDKTDDPWHRPPRAASRKTSRSTSRGKG